ncbi:MAG: HPr family phosphocarrier protein [Gemmatimonadales bacterium]
MIERDVRILNEEGLHARPAARIVRLSALYQSEIEIVKDGLAVNGKSIMGVMMLSAECGSTITFRATGADEALAVDALCDLAAQKFGDPK